MRELRAFGLVAMGDHVGVAFAADFSVAGGARRHAFASHAASPARPFAHVWP